MQMLFFGDTFSVNCLGKKNKIKEERKKELKVHEY